MRITHYYCPHCREYIYVAFSKGDRCPHCHAFIVDLAKARRTERAGYAYMAGLVITAIAASWLPPCRGFSLIGGYLLLPFLFFIADHLRRHGRPHGKDKDGNQ
jgi:hypothetical protein